MQDQQQGSASCVPSAQAVHQPDAATEAPPAADAQLGDSSSTAGQGTSTTCSTEVASHAIADMRSELSLAEASSTVVAQLSEAAAPAAEQPAVVAAEPQLQQPAVEAGEADVAAPALLPLEEEEMGLVPEVVDAEPALMPEASEEPALPQGANEGELRACLALQHMHQALFAEAGPW